MTTSKEFNLSGVNASATRALTNECFGEVVDDLINRIDAARSQTTNATRRASLAATARKLEDAVTEAGAILAELKR